MGRIVCPWTFWMHGLFQVPVHSGIPCLLSGWSITSNCYSGAGNYGSGQTNSLCSNICTLWFWRCDWCWVKSSETQKQFLLESLDGRNRCCSISLCYIILIWFYVWFMYRVQFMLVSSLETAGLKNALMMLSVESSNKRSAAEQVIDKCTDLGEDVKSSLGSCSYAIWTWADAEYFVSAQDFMPESKPQTSEESDRLNLKKRDSDSGFPAPVFPPRFSPAGVCSESLKWMPNKNGLQPVFSGEAFGDVSWVDVSNLRTRHLSAISLLETLENGKAFQRRHPEGLSRVAVNLGGSQCWGGSGGRPRYFLTIVFFLCNTSW